MRKAAEAAGLSRGQTWRALQVASIPEDDFEEMIESEEPPTVTALVRHATGKTDKPQGRRLKWCPHCGADLRKPTGVEP